MLFVSIQKAAYLEQNDWRHILWVPDKAENTGDDGTHDEQAHAKVSMVSEMFWSRNIKRHMMWPPYLPFHLSFFPSCFWNFFVFAFGPCKKSHPQKQNASFCFCERPKARKDRPDIWGKMWLLLPSLTVFRDWFIGIPTFLHDAHLFLSRPSGTTGNGMHNPAQDALHTTHTSAFEWIESIETARAHPAASYSTRTWAVSSTRHQA